MRVLVCPDSVGILSAIEAAEAIADGWHDGAPADEVNSHPLSDGGPGFLSVLRGSRSGTVLDVPSTDPLGQPVLAQVLVTGTTAYVESAQTCGVRQAGDPKQTTTYGLGVVITAAVESGASEIVVGLGGSSTNDGGAGLLAALGAAPLDSAGYALPYGGAALLACTSLGGEPRLRGARLVAATDVDSPLTGPAGASARFGPSMGATASDVVLLDRALELFAAVLEKDLPSCPPGLAVLPGGGAAGGLSAAILACGGRRESGFAVVRSVTGLDAALAASDLVITAQRSSDRPMVTSPVVGGVASMAREQGVACVVLAGQVGLGADDARAELRALAADVAGSENL